MYLRPIIVSLCSKRREKEARREQRFAKMNLRKKTPKTEGSPEKKVPSKSSPTHLTRVSPAPLQKRVAKPQDQGHFNVNETNESQHNNNAVNGKTETNHFSNRG